MKADSLTHGRTPNPRDVLEKAWEDLASLDAKVVARNAGVDIQSDDSIIVPFLGGMFVVRRASQTVTRLESDASSNKLVTALVLHYLTGAKDVNPTGRFVTFRELAGGDVYYNAFHSRVIGRLAKGLGPAPPLLLERAKRIGGHPLRLGDSSAKIPAFPKIPVVVVVWRGDEEVPSSANVLFDSTAGMHLHTEDLAAVGGLVADALVISDEEWRGRSMTF